MTTIDKVTMETEYETLKETAKALGIPFVGVKREKLVENINNKIDETQTEEEQQQDVKNEVDETATENENVDVQDEEQEKQVQEPTSEVNEPTDDSQEGTSNTPENENANDNEDTNNQSSTPAATTVKPGKWHEDGYGNVPGDRVIIIGKHVHQNTDRPKVILQGRIAKVLGPSKKANMIQAILIDPKTGNEQNSPITLAFGEYANEGTIEVEVPQRRNRKKVEQPVEETLVVENQDKEEDADQTQAPAAEDTKPEDGETTSETTNEDGKEDTESNVAS